MSHLLQLNFYKRPPLYERPHFLRTVQRPPLYSSHFLLFPRWPLRRVSTLIMQYNIREYCTPFIFSLSFGLHFTSFSHPSYKNHQGSFHLSPTLVNRKYYIFLAPSKIKGDAYSTKPSGHVILLTSVLLGGLALTAWIWRLPLLSLLMFCELRWNSFYLSVDLF